MTKLAHLAACLSLAFLGVGAGSHQQDFASVKEAIVQLYPKESIIDSDSGDLNGDGRPEIVATLRTDGGSDVGLRIVVFMTNADGRVERWVDTKPVAECRHSTSVSIERKSLVLGCVSWLGIDGGMNFTTLLRFSYRRGTLMQSGEDSTSIEDMNGPKEVTTIESRNLLTGEILETRNGTRTGRRIDPKIRETAKPLSKWEGW